MIEEFPTIEILNTKPVINQVRLEEDELDARSITYIEGSDWDVTYYAQSTTANDKLSLPDPDLPETEQQYIKYDIPLKVTEAIRGDVVDEITGTATVLYFKPNVYDVFVTKLLGGVEVIFKVDEVIKKSMYLKSIYEISYSVFLLVKDSPEVRLMLDGRAIDSFTYNRNTNYLVKRPLLKINEIVIYENLDNYLNLIRKDYLTRFYSKRDLLLLTKDNKVYFDPIINTLYFYIIGDVCNQFNSDMSEFGNVLPYIFIDKNKILLKHLKQPKFKTYVFEYHDEELYLRRLRNNLIYDVDYIISDDGDFILENEYPTLPREEGYLMNDITGEDLTIIESLTFNYINNESLDLNSLTTLAEDYFGFNDSEKYKYGVIIMMLLKYTLIRE